MTTHEGRKPPGPLERVVSRLSIKSVDPNAAGGGEPEFTTADIAAAAAGLRDPVGRELIGVAQGEPRNVDAAVESLDLIGWLAWRRNRPNQQIRAAQHLKIAEAAVAEWQHGPPGWSVRSLCAHIGVSHARWCQLMPHYLELMREIHSAESVLVQHLRQNLKRDVPPPDGRGLWWAGVPEGESSGRDKTVHKNDKKAGN